MWNINCEIYRATAFSFAGRILWFFLSGIVRAAVNDFREGGSYRMRLTYAEAQEGRGKTSEDSDEVEVRLTKLEVGRTIEQEVNFESEDPAFSGVMRLIWTFQPEGEETLVAIRAENVPEGIRPEDHDAGLNSSLENLAEFVKADG